MQFANKIQKSKGQTSKNGNKSLQIKPNSQKTASKGKIEGVRTTSLSKMTEIFLTNPDSVTREEFILFQKAVGYQKALSLLEEGKKRKRQEKIEKIDGQDKRLLIEKEGYGHNSENISEEEKKVGQTEDRSDIDRVNAGKYTAVEAEKKTNK